MTDPIRPANAAERQMAALTPDPPDPQPVPDAYRCGDLNDDEWEVRDWGGDDRWFRPSDYGHDTIRPARRKQAPPLTPREGDIVEGPGADHWPVVHVAHGLAIVDTGETLFAYALSALTVTDRPPKRPVRVWLTDEQVQVWAQPLDGGDDSSTDAAVSAACRALVDEG